MNEAEDPSRKAPSSPPPAATAVTDVSVVVVNYNTAHLLAPMRAALMASKGTLSLQLIVVDNASRDGSVEVLKQDFADADLIFNSVNVGFGRANNQALPRVRGRHVLLLNTDAFIEGDGLTRSVAFMDANSRCGILGVRLVGRDGALQPACRAFPTPWSFFATRSALAPRLSPTWRVDPPIVEADKTRDCDWVVGCFMLVRKATIDACGLFDPRYFLYMEEVDLCKRVRQAGWSVTYFGGATVVHWGGESAKSDSSSLSLGKQISEFQMESQLLYFRKHHGLPGLISFVAAAWLIDSLQALKWLLRRRSLEPVLARAAKLRELLLRTRYGMIPTR